MTQDHVNPLGANRTKYTTKMCRAVALAVCFVLSISIVLADSTLTRKVLY